MNAWVLSAGLLAMSVQAAEAPAEEASSEDEKVGLLQGQLQALEESFLEVKNDASILKRLKLSGYVQGRYQYAEASRQGVDSQNRPTIIDGFLVRRGRLKVQYAGTLAGFMLQLDAVPRGVTVKDAEAQLTEPWTGQKLALVVGQTKWPFGYEIVQSSSDREFPERTRVVRAFGPGERDRGAKVAGRFGPMRLGVGVFDGNGTENAPYTGVDNDKNKDVVGRLGVDLGFLTGGVSGWVGQTYRPPDAMGAGAGTFDRNRIGADVQLYLDLLPFGATAVKGEFIAGKTWMRSGVEQFGVPALGWYALLVQNLGLSSALAVRYDYFDGAAGTVDGEDASGRPLPTNGIGTIGLAAMHYIDEVLKVSAVYEIPLTNVVGSAVDPADNIFTIQLQAKF